MRLRPLFASVLLLSLSLSLFPIAPASPITVHAQPAQTGTARVRFVNAGNAVPALNVYANGRLWAGGITEAVGYLDIPAGAYTFTFQLPRSTEPLTSVEATLDAGQRVTIAAINTLDDLDAIAFVDGVSAPARNAARLRVVHAVPGLDAVRVTVDDEPLAANLGYGEVGAPAQVITGVHDIDVTTLDDEPVVSVAGEFFNPDRAYTLFLTGEADQPRLLSIDSSVLRAQPTTQLRFAHMAPTFGPLVFYVNGEMVPIFGPLDFSSVTPYVITGQGPHTVEVYPQGSMPDAAPPLASVTATIDVQQHVIFTATGSGETLALSAFVTDLSPLPPQSTRLHVIHAAPENPAAHVTTLDDLPLIERVAPGEMAARIVPAGTYGLRLTGAASDALLMERRGLYLAPGTAAALIVFDDDPRQPLVNAVLVAAENVEQQAALRWFNADVQGGSVDVYLDGERVISDWTYGDSTGHRLFEPRRYALSVYRAGTDPDAASPLLAQTLDLRGTLSPRTAVLFGSLDALQLVTLPDSAELLPVDRGRVRFIHAVPDVPRLDVQNRATGDLLARTLTPGTGSVNVNLPPDRYTFEVLRDEGRQAALVPLMVEAGTTYTVVITPQLGSGTALDAVVLMSQP